MNAATLRLAEHVTNLYLHEIALHKDAGGGDLQPPFLEEAMTESQSAKSNVPIGPAHIGALGECLTATHGILDTILSIPLDILLTLPVIFCKLLFILFTSFTNERIRCAGHLRHRLSYEDVGVRY
jgi:hypothetical protein